MKKIIMLFIFLLLFSPWLSYTDAQFENIEPFSWQNNEEWSSLTSQHSAYNYDQILSNNYYFDIDTRYSSWYNHPPLFTSSVGNPISVKAGQTTTSYFNVIDPDNDKLYFSSNLGATGTSSTGDMVWTFSPTFPGLYLLNTVAYDPRGGYALRTTAVHVRPWWSY